MLEFTRGSNVQENEIGAFWSKYALDNERLFYKEVLGQLSGPQVHPDTQQYRAYLQRSSDPELLQIKGKLQDHLIKNDISVEHLFAFLDKDKSRCLNI